MPSIGKLKQQEILRHIRDYRAIVPNCTIVQVQQRLFGLGYQTAHGNPLHKDYVNKMMKKATKQVLEQMDRQSIQKRVIEIREKTRMVCEQLSRIAFWSPQMGIAKPEYKDQIKALEQLVKLDLSVLSAEMDAGIFERALGKLKVEHGLAEEEKMQIRKAMQSWGLLKKPKTKPVILEGYVTNQKQDNADKLVGAIIQNK